MLTLALDTSSASGSLAFLRDETVIGAMGTSSGEIHSSRIFRHLEFMLRELSLRMEDFDLFAVAAGPGSFTGLRVGLTAVKGWAEVFGKPIAAVSALEAVAAQSRASAVRIASVMDARRNELYWGFYRRRDTDDGTRLVQENHEMVGSREEFVRAITSREGAEEVAIATPTADALSGILPQLENRDVVRRTISLDRVSPFLASEIGRLGWLRAREDQVVDALTLDANYIRRSDAELHWKGSSGS
ncbi:MAG: tRNA (adenosine(37)-N6)-threonylcarbamoyltransferase complex dimerization subunit type 1 TsaB [Candidatus Acidiferrales bacterium]